MNTPKDPEKSSPFSLEVSGVDLHLYCNLRICPEGVDVKARVKKLSWAYDVGPDVVCQREFVIVQQAFDLGLLGIVWHDGNLGVSKVGFCRHCYHRLDGIGRPHVAQNAMLP